MDQAFDILITFAGVGVILFLYTLPSFVAYMKHHKRFGWILAFNLALGFLIIPWIATLFWAIVSPSGSDVVRT